MTYKEAIENVSDLLTNTDYKIKSRINDIMLDLSKSSREEGIEMVKKVYKL